jgi:hypothetical protein
MSRLGRNGGDWTDNVTNTSCALLTSESRPKKMFDVMIEKFKASEACNRSCFNRTRDLN